MIVGIQSPTFGQINYKRDGFGKVIPGQERRRHTRRDRDRLNGGGKHGGDKAWRRDVWAKARPLLRGQISLGEGSFEVTRIHRPKPARLLINFEHSDNPGRRATATFTYHDLGNKQFRLSEPTVKPH